MNTEDDNSHQTRIQRQFTRQAATFTRLPGHFSGMDLLLALAEVKADDEVLDVACGPGLVACAFAPHVRHVEGVDMTTAMIQEARKRQETSGLPNLSWRHGTANPLPYEDNRFTLVVTRFSLHHFEDPHAAFLEMVRVCKPGGRILVADVVQPSEKAEAFDRMERMRDPSHARVLTSGVLEHWFKAAELSSCRTGTYCVDIRLEDQLRASFPEPGDEERIRALVTQDIGLNHVGVGARLSGGEVIISYPVTACVGTKTSP